MIQAETTSSRSPQTEPAFVTHSKYFSPVFNAAIFDGPIRIYFAQAHESQALKIYFNLQERFAKMRAEGKGIFKNRSRNVFVMLYPNEETFDLSFAPEARMTGSGAVVGPSQFVHEKWGSDVVVGVCGPLADEDLENFGLKMDAISSTELP